MELRRGDLRVVGGDRLEAFVPERHRVDDAVGLGGGGDVPARTRARQLEGVAHDPVRAAAGEDALLHHRLVFGSGEHAPADLRVLAFVVLPHHPEVDVLGAAPAQRRFNAPQQPHRAQVDVLLELPTNRNEQTPKRHVVRHAGESHGAEEDRVEAANGVEAALGHHRARCRIALAAPVEVFPLEADAEAAGDRIENANALRHRLLADAVAGNDGDAMGSGHGFVSGDVVRGIVARELAHRFQARRGMATASGRKGCGAMPLAGESLQSVCDIRPARADGRGVKALSFSLGVRQKSDAHPAPSTQLGRPHGIVEACPR